MAEPNNKDKELIYAKLKDGLVEVKFLKADGTVRHMKATLAAQYLPPAPTATTDNGKGPVDPLSKPVVTVFDIEAKEWRSFKWTALVSVTIPF